LVEKSGLLKVRWRGSDHMEADPITKLLKGAWDKVIEKSLPVGPFGRVAKYNWWRLRILQIKLGEALSSSLMTPDRRRTASHEGPTQSVLPHSALYHVQLRKLTKFSKPTWLIKRRTFFWRSIRNW